MVPNRPLRFYVPSESLDAYQIYLEVSTCVTLICTRAVTTTALGEAWYAQLSTRHDIVSSWTFVIALLAFFVFGTLLANLLMNSVTGTDFTPRVAFFANGVSNLGPKFSLFLGVDPFVVVAWNEKNHSVNVCPSQNYITL